MRALKAGGTSGRESATEFRYAGWVGKHDPDHFDSLGWRCRGRASRSRRRVGQPLMRQAVALRQACCAAATCLVSEYPFRYERPAFPGFRPMPSDTKASEKTLIEPRLPRGFEDRLPGDIAAVDRDDRRTLRAVYERYGFDPSKPRCSNTPKRSASSCPTPTGPTPACSRCRTTTSSG